MSCNNHKLFVRHNPMLSCDLCHSNFIAFSVSTEWGIMESCDDDNGTLPFHKCITPHWSEQAYFFIGSSQVCIKLESNEKSGMKRKGCKTKTVSENVTMSTTELSWKQPSAASVNSQRPVGRDSAKNRWLLSSLSRRLQKALQRLLHRKLHRLQMHLQWRILKRAKGLARANDIMQTMANCQVMSMAPPDIKDRHFSEVFELINEQARKDRKSVV